MEKLAPYNHLPITCPNTIRVLKLSPAASPSDPLHCSLLQIRIDTSPVQEFTALSYTWESQTPSHSISCDNGVLLITANCVAALRALRQSDEPVTLWIDSICIDQRNLAEKSIQVAMMGQIYSSASRVNIWLGEWDDALVGAVKSLRRIVPTELQASLTGASGGSRSEESGAILQRKAYDNVLGLVKGLKTVADDPFAPLFNRSWFRRMWTIQEVTLAKMNKVFIYGGHGPDLSFQWITLTAATDALKVMKYPYGHIEKAVKSQRLLAQLLLAERLPLVRELLQRKPGNKISRPILWKILLDAREKESSDPRDKIFALFGVLEELKIQCPIPDYQKSIEDVYREAVVACINHDKNLKVLFDVPSDRRYLRPDLSSWVPDWSDEGWRSGNVAEARIAVTGDRFCAAGPADPKWSFSHDQRRLILSGKVLDSVIYCADPLNIDRNVVASLKPQSQIVRTPSSSQYTLQDALRLVHSTFLIVKSWAEVASWYGDYPTGETVQQALFRTLVADTSPENQQEPVAIDSWFRLMMTSDNEKAIQSHPQASKCYSSIAGFADRRALFTTEKGYMGTAPARITATEAMNLIQAGDMIAVVAGLEMPVALRPVEIEDQGRRVYQYVSHVYVHGIMYGEAWEDEKLALQDIVLL